MTRTIMTFDGIGHRFGTAIRAARPERNPVRGLFVRFDDGALTFVARATLGRWWRLAPDAKNEYIDTRNRRLVKGPTS